MSWPPRFLFHSGRLSLDFAHTGGTGRFKVFERLHTGRDFADWLAESSLGLEFVRVTKSDLTAAIKLQSAIWSAAQSVKRGERPTRLAVATIHAAAAKPDLVPLLVGSSTGWESGATAIQALSTLARDAIALLGSDLRNRVRECKNPKCPLLFVDTSRPGHRAWCTMQRCGNLEKTSRYRRSVKNR